MARAAFRHVAARRRLDAALPVGCVDSVGDKGARLVFARPDRPVRSHRRVVRRERCAVVRRFAELPRHCAAVAGMVERRARPLGRFADEPAMVARRRRIRDRDLRRLAGKRSRASRCDHRRVARVVAAARQRARRACRLCRPADGRLLRAGRARRVALVARANRCERASRAAVRRRVRRSDTRRRLGTDAAAWRRPRTDAGAASRRHIGLPSRC